MTSGGRAPTAQPVDASDLRAFIDLHCHTGASFDCLASPVAVVRAAMSRGLTHLAITDHDRISGALEAVETAPPGVTIIIGEEIKSIDGDILGIFLREAVPPGLSAAETVDAIREQGGLVGIPHPFDGRRGFGRKSGVALEEIADSVDWIEVYNARVLGGSANEKAALFAHDHGLPGLAASDAHTVLEVGVAYNVVGGDPCTPDAMLRALRNVEITTGRASYYVRAWTPLAKVVQSLSGRGRVNTQGSTGEDR
jgi:predicted metal-dependent phosphoesterase TrpH